MKLTVRKIAALAGVSPATVSLVLNDKPGVRPDVREKLTALLEENGYAIRKQKDLAPKKILYLSYKYTEQIPFTRNDLIPLIMESVQNVCREKNYSLSIVNVNKNTLDDFLQEAREKYDGVIFQGTEYKCDDYTRYEDFPIPILFIDHYIYGHHVNTLNTDGRASCYLPLAHLKELGHTEIGLITTKQNYGTFFDREDYFYQMMKKLDLPIIDEYIYHLDYFQEDLQAEFRQHLKQRSKLPTAFLAGNDMIAVPAFFALTQEGHKIPEDISIIGYNNSAVSRMTSPQLTTVNINMERYGKLAMERLSQMIESPSPDVLKISIGTSLTIRGTTAPPKKA